MGQVSYGTITITDTNDIERIYTVYAKSIDNTTIPVAEASDWKESISEAPGTGNYIWQRTVVQKSGTEEKTYSDPVCLTGEEGDSAKNITAIETQYGISADWNTQPSSWSNDTPNYDSSKPNYWIRTRLKYEDNTYSSWVVNKDYALTDAVYTAAVANSIAQSANENSQGALSIANGVAQHFFFIESDYNSGIPAGAYVAEQGVDSFKANPTGGNLITRSDGIYIRKGTILLTSLTGTALTFYNPSTTRKTIELTNNSLTFYNPTDGTTEQAVLDTNGLVLKKGGVKAGTAGQSGFIYLSTENYGSNLTINSHQASNWREIIGTKFGVDADGNLYASNAEISGKITASSLTIGSGATVSGLSTSNISGINNYATVTAAQGYANDASYSVEIEVRNIVYTTPTATLFAHVYYKGGELTSSTNPAISSINFQWKKVVENSGTYSVTDISGATSQSLVTSDLDTTYICVIS